MRPGESVGLVGENGAGKSTLLKLIAGILAAELRHGEILVAGSWSLLELGAGFHPDFTGRENAILNASIHGGHAAAEIDRRMERIIEFAEASEPSSTSRCGPIRAGCTPASGCAVASELGARHPLARRDPRHEGRFAVSVFLAHAEDHDTVYHWIDRRFEFSVFPRSGGIGAVDMSGSWEVEVDRPGVGAEAERD